MIGVKFGQNKLLISVSKAACALSFNSRISVFLVRDMFLFKAGCFKFKCSIISAFQKAYTILLSFSCDGLGPQKINYELFSFVCPSTLKLSDLHFIFAHHKTPWVNISQEPLNQYTLFNLVSFFATIRVYLFLCIQFKPLPKVIKNKPVKRFKRKDEDEDYDPESENCEDEEVHRPAKKRAKYLISETDDMEGYGSVTTGSRRRSSRLQGKVCK